MGSAASICNATNIILNLALSQVGPLYYQNRVMPGECWKQGVGKVWFTVDASLYTGKEDIYTDWSVARPITSWSLIGIGTATALVGGVVLIKAGAASAAVGSAATVASSASSVASFSSGATLVNTFTTGAGGLTAIGTTAGGTFATGGGIVLEVLDSGDVEKAFKNLSVSEAGFYFGSDRTIYIAGGPPKDHVSRNETHQVIRLENGNVNRIYITETKPTSFRWIRNVDDGDSYDDIEKLERRSVSG